MTAQITALVRTPETLDEVDVRRVIVEWLGPQRMSLYLSKDIDRMVTGAIAYSAATRAATPSPTPPEGPETLSERVWREALARPSFRAALDEGLADLEAGRTEQWATVRQRLRAASPAPDPGAGLRELSEAATAGPWVEWGDFEYDHLRFPRISHKPGDGTVFGVAAVISWDRRQENRAFIVAAVNYVRSLLAPSAEPPETET